MQTIESIKAVIADCQYNDWMFRVDTNEGGTPYVQVLFKDKDRITGKEEIQRCRKWMLSYHMGNSEVVRTVFQAIQGAVAHEVNEAFKYKGTRIFNPHMDYDELAQAIRGKVVGVQLRDESTYVPTVVS